MSKEILANSKGNKISNQEFFSHVIKLQRNIAGVEITGSTREERVSKMKKLFIKNR